MGMLSSPEHFGGSVSKQDNRQHIISLNAKQSRSLIKRAGRWPSIGNLLPEQVLTTELLQKIVDIQAEPIYSKHCKGLQLREFNKETQPTHKEMQPTSETMSNCEEPWNDLSTRKQRALLLEGIEITRAFLVQLKELMQMNNDEGEPCGYGEVLQAVLHYGSACARGEKKANRLDISEDSVPSGWLSKI